MGKVVCCSGVAFSWKLLIGEIVARVILLSAYVGLRFVDPFQRYVLDWGDHDYPLKKQEIPNLAAVLVVGGSFVVCTLFWLLVLKFAKKFSKARILYEFCMILLSFSLAVLMTLMVTELIKVFYGRPRPDFLARCYLNQADRPSPIPPMPLCNGPAKLVKEGRKSFPSGHASNTVASFVWIALYSYYCLCFFKDCGGIRLVAPFSLLVYPIVVCISRTRDYVHFPTDVLGGAIIGAFLSTVVFKFYHVLYSPVRDKTRMGFEVPFDVDFEYNIEL